MAQIHAVLIRQSLESDLEFRERCGLFILFGAHGGAEGFAVARMSASPDPFGLVPDVAWGLAYASEPLPSEVCIIASYPERDARLAVHPFEPLDLAAAPVNPGVLPQAAHRMSLRNFALNASVRALSEAGHKWEVFLNLHSMGHSSAVTQEEAIVDVHARAVRDALYSLSPEAAPPASMSAGHVLPTVEAIGSHLALLGTEHKTAMQLATSPRWSPALRAAAVAGGWDLVDDDGRLQVQTVGVADADTCDECVWAGTQEHEVVARTLLYEKSPLEYARLRMSVRDHHQREAESLGCGQVD